MRLKMFSEPIPDYIKIQYTEYESDNNDSTIPINELTTEIVQKNVLEANKILRNVQKHAHEIRERFLYDLEELYADIQNRDKEQIVQILVNTEKTREKSAQYETN